MTTNSMIAERRADGRPPPGRFASRAGGSGLKLAAAGAAALVFLLAALPFFADRGVIQILFSAMTMLALAQFWNLLAGYAGLVSVGQQGFVGLGGYFLFAAATFAGIDPLFAVPLAGLFAALVALPSAWLIFRLQGAYFAIGTWVLAEVFRTHRGADQAARRGNRRLLVKDGRGQGGADAGDRQRDGHARARSA